VRPAYRGAQALAGEAIPLWIEQQQCHRPGGAE